MTTTNSAQKKGQRFAAECEAYRNQNVRQAGPFSAVQG